MRIYLIINFIFLLFSIGFGSGHYNDCPVERCSKHGPKIRFPFRLKGRQPEHCGYPGFDLYCSQSKETVLENPFLLKASSINQTTLQYSAKFIVKEIDYRSQLITLSNKVDGCFPGLLPHLNLSSSPFRFWPEYLDDGYTFLNCSSSVKFYDPSPITCLSSSSYHVYATYSQATLAFVPLSCLKMFNISSIPVGLLDESMPWGPTQLNWSKPTCGDCEVEGKYC